MVSVEALRCCELFPGLSNKELAQIAAISRQETYDTGTWICTEREPADRLYILLTGRVQLHVRLSPGLEPGGEAIIDEVEPGRIFGWSSLVKQRRFTASAQAMEPVTAIVIQGDELNALCDQDTHLGFVVLKQLALVIASRLDHTRHICEKQRKRG